MRMAESAFGNQGVLMRRLLDRLAEFLFRPPQEGRGARAGQAAFLTILFALGALHWVAFLNAGELRMTVEDWPLQLMYDNVLQQAVTQHTMPWHTSREVLNTTHFLAIPETTLSPQVLALARLPVGLYALCNILLLYAVGFIGCLLIRRKYRLPAFAAAVLWLLFNFNGFVTSHVGVGHAWFPGYFFLPFFCLLVLDLAEGKAGLGAAIALAFVLFAMLLQGAFHIVIWCGLFLALMAAFHKPSRATAAWAILFTALLGAFRLVPSAMEYRGKSMYHFVSGHRSLYDLFQSFVAIKEHSEFSIGGIFGRQGWWEYDYYVGLLGLAALIFLGIVVRWRKDFLDLRGREYKALDWPLGLMALLSMSYFWAFIARLPLPLVNSERASSRFLIIPVLMLLVIACARMPAALDRLSARGNWKWLLVPAFLLTAFEIVNHSVRWSVALFERTEIRYPYPVDVQITAAPATAYETVFKLSLVVSAATAMVLIGLLVWRRFFTTKTPSHQERKSST
jgi:hypothetical protein